MIGWLLTALGKLVPVINATSRLVRAAKESLRPKPPAPPPPIGESGAREASAYLDGAADVEWRRLERERLQRSAEELARKAADDEPVEAEQPSDGGKP